MRWAMLKAKKRSRVTARAYRRPELDDGQPVFATLSDNGTRYRCAVCFAMLNPFTNTMRTLRRCGNALDANDPLHWECDACGHSDVPSAWLGRYEVRQLELFGDGE